MSETFELMVKLVVIITKNIGNQMHLLHDKVANNMTSPTFNHSVYYYCRMVCQTKGGNISSPLARNRRRWRSPITADFYQRGPKPLIKGAWSQRGLTFCSSVSNKLILFWPFNFEDMKLVLRRPPFLLHARSKRVVVFHRSIINLLFNKRNDERTG